MRTRTLIILSVSLTCVGIGLTMYSNSRKAPESESQATPVREEAPAVSPIENEKEQAVAAGEIKTPAAGVAKPEIIAVWKDYKYSRDLQKYTDLGKKAILLEPDKLVKRRLLKDENFLRSLETLMKTAPVDEASQAMQNSALDFVFESLNTDMRQVAIEVLKNVVADPTVENTAVNEMDRKVLAGVKAEALYQWSAVDPSAERSINGLLPGPVSEKIWVNVKKQQDSNLGESAMLQASQQQ
ncbi:hypothetical protein EZJ49_08965 [Bdellovibrio bacteriovorus]|uniref:hypothetical protein n=1 Tax=Bdellovibrio bacteriovorus TaxID=959 RepID=UPI0021D08B13|nr:hypothetical protein [Bdellovibrio bacteriovorus]UXR63207.1 hypothetical protein EZJ49_08965 [Bdellovibrio bacteriovorus]